MNEKIQVAFVDEMKKIAARGVPPKKSLLAKRKTQGMDVGARFLELLKGRGKGKK